MGYKNKQDMKAEVCRHLCEISKFGEKRDEAKEEGDEYKYIYSYNTFGDYKLSMFHLIDYCKSEHRCTTVNECEKYVPEYIEKLIEDKKSSYTQKSYLSAYRKYYQNEFKDVVTESRSRSRISRSRTVVDQDRHFSEERNSELVYFCQHTGMRRSELERLHGNTCSQHNDGHWYIDGVHGKGGRHRDIRILNDDQKVIDKINGTSKEELVFGKVNGAADIHSYRADYAKALYHELARDVNTLSPKEMYICRNDRAGEVLDRDAMREVSNNMGHNRVSVIAGHYLY